MPNHRKLSPVCARCGATIRGEAYTVSIPVASGTTERDFCAFRCYLAWHDAGGEQRLRVPTNQEGAA